MQDTACATETISQELRSLRAESRAQGWAEVRAEARAKSIAKGKAEGGTESRARMVREVLLARGIELSEEFLADPSALAELPESAIVAAALACDSERDFLLRLSRGQS